MRRSATRRQMLSDHSRAVSGLVQGDRLYVRATLVNDWGCAASGLHKRLPLGTATPGPSASDQPKLRMAGGRSGGGLGRFPAPRWPASLCERPGFRLRKRAATDLHHKPTESRHLISQSEPALEGRRERQQPG